MSGHLISTPARRAVCPQCGAPVLAAIAEGLSAAVDVEPVDLGGEVRARLAGRMTYGLARIGGDLELIPRDCEERVRTRRWPVHADHPCPQARLTARDPGDRHPPYKRRRKS